MSEGQVKKTVTLVDPFTGHSRQGCDPVQEKEEIDYNQFQEIGLELDKDTGNTVVVVTGTFDMQKKIQEFKDQCGFEGMRKLIAAGQATPKDFYDDGKHGQDVSGLPDNVNDAFRAAQASGLKKDEMLAKLGVDESDGIDETEQKIKAAVEAYFKNLAASTVSSEVKNDESK